MKVCSSTYHLSSSHETRMTTQYTDRKAGQHPLTNRSESIWENTEPRRMPPPTQPLRCKISLCRQAVMGRPVSRNCERGLARLHRDAIKLRAGYRCEQNLWCVRATFNAEIHSMDDKNKRLASSAPSRTSA